MSGKAMQVTIPPGTALREMVRRKESEGHCCGFAASFVISK
jgi:Fe-S oxidoreductase